MDTTAKIDPEVSQSLNPEIIEGKASAAIGYLSFLCFAPLFLKRGNKFAQFHGRQALVLFILEVCSGIVLVVPVVGDVVFRFTCLIFGVFSLLGMAKALMNQYWEMPVVHPIAAKITF